MLDFGLAKPLERPSHPADLTRSPTVLSPAPTLAGFILGTPAYMSPEQARGKPVDKGTDIWAFGCVLYEMLTGKTPFPGETVTDIADARFQIEEVLDDPGPSPVMVTPARRSREWAPRIAATLLLGTTLFFATRSSTTSSSDAIRFPVFPREKDEFSARIDTTLDVPSFALSPDGRAVVFSAETAGARPMLWLRPLNEVDARPLAGTEGAQDPFWSPDSRWIGFFADGTLRKVPAGGGAVQVIVQIRSDFRGATWGAGDTILVASGMDGVVSVNAAGGSITSVTVVDTSLHEDSHRNPSFLPDGHHFLYSVIGAIDRSGVYVGSLDGKTKTREIELPTSAVYTPPGYLLFVDGDTLLGQPFDADRLELTGNRFS